MPNVGLETTRMSGLWSEKAFRALLPEQWEPICSQLRVEKKVSFTLRCSDFLSVLREHVGEDVLHGRYKPSFLADPDSYPPIICILDYRDPDSITTMRNYSPDTRLSEALSLVLPGREISCSWFIDGSGDFGSYKMINGEVIEKQEGNVNENTWPSKQN